MKPAQRKNLPKGMGQRKGAGGHVYYYSRLRGENGKRDCRIVHGTDLELAKLEHQRLRLQRVRQPWVPVGAAWRQWIALDIGRKWKPKCSRLVEGRFKRYVDPLLGNKRVADLTGDDSRRLARRLADEKLAAQTQGHVLTNWSRFGRWLESEGFVRQSPVPHGLRPRVPESEPDPLSEDELSRLHGIGERYELPIRLMLATGLRWSDAVRVQASNLTSDGWLVISCSKTGRLLRIPLGEMDTELAREMRQRVGRLVDLTNVGSFNRAVQRRSGLERFSTYRLRDTFACRWMSEGGSISDLQRILGHRAPETTMRYGRPSDARLGSEARRIGEAQRARSQSPGEVREMRP